MSVSLGLFMGALGPRSRSEAARETATEKSGVSGISLSRADGWYITLRSGRRFGSFAASAPDCWGRPWAELPSRMRRRRSAACGCLEIGSNSGRLLWRSRPLEHFGQRREDAANWNARFSGRAAGWMTPFGLMVRFTFEGRTVRMLAARVAWAISTGRYPLGVVAPRDGDAANMRPEALERSRDWRRVGGPSLDQRRAADARMLDAMRRHPGATIVEIAGIAVSGKPSACRRLDKLAAPRLACGPQCLPSRHWALTGAGLTLAASAAPLVDALDRDILRVLALRDHIAAASIARRIDGHCEMTVRRRLRGLAERGLAANGAGWSLTGPGLAAIGGRPAPWVAPLQTPAAVHHRDALVGSLSISRFG